MFDLKDLGKDQLKAYENPQIKIVTQTLTLSWGGWNKK